MNNLEDVSTSVEQSRICAANQRLSASTLTITIQYTDVPKYRAYRWAWWECPQLYWAMVINQNGEHF